MASSAAVLSLAILVMMPPHLALAAPTGRGKTKFRQGMSDAMRHTLSADDLRLAYQLFDFQNPFPSDAIASNTPLARRVSGALGRAVSLHPSCVWMHLLILLALTLNAVQVKYSGLLGRFCNLMLLQHGSPGDGKSVALWLVIQILRYFDKKEDEYAQQEYSVKLRQRRASKAGNTQPQNEDDQVAGAPLKPDARDSALM